MTEQEAIAEAVLNTPDPDRFVDCGESRPLPMFHMATLMQYGEQCANAALAYLRSQGKPVAITTNSHIAAMRNGAERGIYARDPVFAAIAPRETDVPLYLAPVAKVPAGWRLVPMEPTKEMCDAMPVLPAIRTEDLPLAKLGWNGSSVMNRQRYLAAIAAAPEYKEE